MGWSYEERLAYGIIVNAWNNPDLKRLLLELADVVSYDKEMSLDGPGTVFIYLNSSYKTLREESGSYAYSSPDPIGNELSPPKHPIIHRLESNASQRFSLKRTLTEVAALRKIRKLCNTNVKPVWIRHSYISY